MTYPTSLDTAISDQDNSAISQILIAALKAAYTGLTKSDDEKDMVPLETLHAILNRLLDPDQIHDDIVEPEDLLKIITTCAPHVEDMTKSGSMSDSKLFGQMFQGLMAWIGTTQAFVILGDLVGHERKWYSKPQQAFAQHDDCNDILTSLQPFVNAFNFIPSTIRERNRKFQQYPLLYNLSHTYLTWISGFQAYFGGRLMESANTLMNTTTSATAILQHLTSHYPTAVPFVNGNGEVAGINGDEILAQVDRDEYLPTWLSYKRCHAFLLKAQLDSIMTIIKFVPVLPHNALKAKLLTTIVSNDVFQSQKKDIDEYFFPGASTRVVYFGTQQRNTQDGNTNSGTPSILKTPFEAFPSLITNTVLITRADRELAKSDVVLWSECVEKLIKNGVLSRFELNYIAAINKTPVHTLQELNSRSDAQGTSVDGMDSNAMADGEPEELRDGKSPFAHPTLSPLLQHNLLTVTAYTTSISFPQLCIVLGLDPKGKRVVDGLKEMVRGMILSNILPQGWSKINDAVVVNDNNTDTDRSVSVLNLDNAVEGTLGRVEATMESRSLFLRHVYDAAIDGEKYNRQWQQQGNGKA